MSQQPESTDGDPESLDHANDGCAKEDMKTAAKAAEEEQQQRQLESSEVNLI